ncbi:MAG: heparan-alpha-glucosaminide N-acetyltransferase domain-containing protein [Candidatus Syntropharchaeales archaeon]
MQETIIGVYLKNLTFGFSWLLWLGFRPENFYTLDYFPVFPWFGMVLIGLFLGNVLYPNYTRMYDLWNNSHSSLVKLFCAIGRRSLLIYLAHQPILIALLQIFGFETLP